LRQLALFLGLIALAFGMAIAPTSQADDPVRILVLRENGIGSSAQIQPYLDKLVEEAKSKNGWATAEGKYTTKRSAASKYLEKNGSSVKFGMISLGAFLGMRGAQPMTVVGTVDAAGLGGRRYNIVSKNKTDLAGCKGGNLATNHAGDEKFINKVVSGGDFILGDFVVKESKRPLQPIKAVISDEADCALIDDAQFKELSHIEGGAALKSVWKSKELPPMAVVAFSGATEAERAKFKSTLDSICSGGGAETCKKVGIQALKAADESVYTSVIDAYGR
jgi:hypothetical protein